MESQINLTVLRRTLPINAANIQIWHWFQHYQIVLPPQDQNTGQGTSSFTQNKFKEEEKSNQENIRNALQAKIPAWEMDLQIENLMKDCSDSQWFIYRVWIVLASDP